MKLFSIVFALLVSQVSTQAVEPPVQPMTTPMEYTHMGDDLLGHLAAPEGDGPFPAIVVIP